MLLFDSVWKREGEESIGRETGSQTDRGSVSQQRPNEKLQLKVEMLHKRGKGHIKQYRCSNKEAEETLHSSAGGQIYSLRTILSLNDK